MELISDKNFTLLIIALVLVVGGIVINGGKIF